MVSCLVASLLHFNWCVLWRIKKKGCIKSFWLQGFFLFLHLHTFGKKKNHNINHSFVEHPELNSSHVIPDCQWRHLLSDPQTSRQTQRCTRPWKMCLARAAKRIWRWCVQGRLSSFVSIVEPRHCSESRDKPGSIPQKEKKRTKIITVGRSHKHQPGFWLNHTIPTKDQKLTDLLINQDFEAKFNGSLALPVNNR